MTTESVLRRSWDLLGKHWQYAALVALIGAAISIVVAFLTTGSIVGGGFLAMQGEGAFDPEALFSGAGLGGIAIGGLISLLVLPWVSGASAHAGKELVTETASNPWQPYQAALGQYLTYLLLGIVLAIVLGIGFMLFVIPGIVLAVLLGLSPTIVAFEGVGVGEALKRAWELGLKHFWTILLVGIIVAAVAFVLSLVLGWVPLLNVYIPSLVGVFGSLAMAELYTQAK